MAFKDTIKLVNLGNLIMGNAPSKKIKLDQVANKLKAQRVAKHHTQSFGFFDTNTSNYNTYYPNVTAKDLKPSKSEFIEPVFRALSEVVVHKEYNPVDFSRGRVLRKSMSLLKGQTVNTDHEDAVGNALGAVSQVQWQDSYKDSNGILIPAGINSRLKIDGKSHPRIARAIMMDPPAIHSTSVTVQFLWEKSHPEMSDDEFWKNLGGYDKESNLITRVALEIKRYNEISLVSHGADPFAQLIKDNGELNNPKYANIVYNSVSGKAKRNQRFFLFDNKTDLIKNSEKNTIPKELIIDNNHSTKKGMKKPLKKTTTSSKKLIALIAKQFGLEKFNQEDPKQLASLEKKIVRLKNSSKHALTSEQRQEYRELKEQKAEFDKVKKRYEKLKEEKTTRLKGFRKEVLRNYTLSVNGDKDSSIVDTINEADEKTLKALNKEYSSKLEQKYPTTCGDCGSSNITKASTSQSEEENEGEILSFEQIEAEVTHSGLDSSTKLMH